MWQARQPVYKTSVERWRRYGAVAGRAKGAAAGGGTRALGPNPIGPLTPMTDCQESSRTSTTRVDEGICVDPRPRSNCSAEISADNRDKAGCETALRRHDALGLPTNGPMQGWSPG